MISVLFTCAGQRVDIVSAFARAGATTIAADLDPLAPALYHADVKALVPRVDDAGYVPTLASLVAEHDVRLVAGRGDDLLVEVGERYDEPDVVLGHE